MRTTLTIVAIIAIPSACLAWNGHEVTEGDLKILIEEVDPVTRRDAPVDVTVSLTNSGDEDISGTLEARGMVDDSRVVGDTRKPFEVAAGETVEVGIEDYLFSHAPTTKLRSFYVRFGSVFPWLCLLSSLALGILAWKERRLLEQPALS